MHCATQVVCNSRDEEIKAVSGKRKQCHRTIWVYHPRPTIQIKLTSHSTGREAWARMPGEGPPKRSHCHGLSRQLPRGNYKWHKYIQSITEWNRRSVEPYKNAPKMESKDFTERCWPQKAQQCERHGPERNHLQRKWINFGSQSQPIPMTADSEP